MSTKEFQGIYNPSDNRHPVEASQTAILKNFFTIPQFFTFGALVQVFIFLVLPYPYSLIPVLALFVHFLGTTFLPLLSSTPKTYHAGIVPGSTSTVFPKDTYDSKAGESPFGSKPAAESIVVLHLGVRFVHPSGPLAPGIKEILDHNTRCNKMVLEQKEFGCIGISGWMGTEDEKNNTLLTVYYFRSLEGLNAFAHGKTHREAWEWYNQFSKKLGYTHIGVYHEAFYSPAGGYETIYLNMPPTLLGATNVQVINETTGKEEWIRPLVNADVIGLRGQMTRLGRNVKQLEMEGGL